MCQESTFKAAEGNFYVLTYLLKLSFCPNSMRRIIFEKLELLVTNSDEMLDADCHLKTSLPFLCTFYLHRYPGTFK